MIVKFREIADFIAGQSPESKYYSDNDGVPFLQGNRTFGVFYPTIDTYTTKVTKMAKKGDILMSVRAPVGDLNFSNQDVCIGRGLSAIRSKTGNNQFLFYALKYNIKNLLRQSSGTTFDSITRDVIEDMNMIIPDDETSYSKISKLLYNIDLKIINNNKINAELESMAKTLYDYWFLQFEFPNEEGKPYKSSGGKMVWNDELKREIPEGWRVIKLAKVLNKVNREFDYSKESKTYDLSIIPSNSIAINDTSSSKKFETNLFAVKQGDLLFGSIRPYLRKAGIASYDGAVAGTIHCYEVKNKFDYNLALFTISSENFFNYAINNSKGTKMPVVSSDDLLEFIIPYNEEVAKKFNGIYIKEKIIANVHQSNELSSLRDFLLPLLMNGQVTFKDESYE
jgi:type I restriction enzyme S subunit